MKRIASFPEKKQVVFLFLLLSLLLSACAAAPELETTPYSLPAPMEPIVLQDPEWVPILTPHTVSNPQISGPLGQVNALRYREGSCLDPVYGDVDGDGQTELVYRSPSADRGTVYEGVWIYGIEWGWPVQKGSGLLRIGRAKTGLVLDGSRVCYSYLDPAAEQEQPLLLPLTLENGRLRLEGELPQELILQSDRVTDYGCSFSELRTNVGENLVAVAPNYFLWQEPGVLHTEEDLAAEGWKAYTCAAVTENGMTVTELVYWYTGLDGTERCSEYGVVNMDWVNAESLNGTVRQLLTDRLGEPCFETRSEARGDVLHWFTTDGKLLEVWFEDGLSVSALTELPSVFPAFGFYEQDGSEKDTGG